MSMRRQRSLSAAGLFVVLFVAPSHVAAQDEATLRTFFEGKRVVVTVDMPGTSDGVDLDVDAARALDARQYGERLKTYGTAIRAGDSVVVTLVKVKKDLIEFQLGGGGFGTFGDDTSTSVSITLVEKSARERELERLITDEDNPRRRREFEREREALRDRRERENRRLEAAKVEAEERRRARVADERLHGGSRFNLRYENIVPRGITPREVMAALGDYVDFSGWPGAVSRLGDRQSSAPDDRGPRKGMTRAEAEQVLGAATSSSIRQEGRLRVVTLIFLRGDERIEAEFVEDVLIRYVTSSR